MKVSNWKSPNTFIISWQNRARWREGGVGITAFRAPSMYTHGFANESLEYVMAFLYLVDRLKHVMNFMIIINTYKKKDHST